MINSDMTNERALQIVQKVIDGRTRWGKQFKPAITQGELFDAMIIVHAENSADNAADVAEIKAELTKANRQNGMAKTRETKLRQENDALKAQIGEYLAEIKDLIDKLEKTRVALNYLDYFYSELPEYLGQDVSVLEASMANKYTGEVPPEYNNERSGA